MYVVAVVVVVVIVVVVVLIVVVAAADYDADWTASLQGGPKMAPFFVRLITSPNINRFSKFFAVKIGKKFGIIISL